MTCYGPEFTCFSRMLLRIDNDRSDNSSHIYIELWYSLGYIYVYIYCSHMAFCECRYRIEGTCHVQELPVTDTIVNRLLKRFGLPPPGTGNGV